MADQNLRVWPVTDDGYGDVIEYPAYAKYRMEPHYPGAAGNENTDLVVFERTTDPDTSDGEKELGRHCVAEVLIAFSGQPTPLAVLESENERTATVAGSSTETNSGLTASDTDTGSKTSRKSASNATQKTTG